MKKSSFSLLFLMGIFPLAAQQTTVFPSLEPDSRAAQYGRKLGAGTIAWEDLAAASLWASGGEVSGAAMNSLRAAAAELRTSLLMDPREKGDFLLSYLHRKFLKSYSALQTRVDTILTNGRYNCVSSAALYLVLAAAMGLEVEGVMTKDHAFIRVKSGQEFIDVETTNPYGFDPGNRREFHDAFGTVTGFAYVSSRNYQDRASISQVELISLIFTNRISELEAQRRFGEAIPLAVNRAALLADRRTPSMSPLFPDPAVNLMDRLFNYGVSLVQGGRETEALQWAALASARYSDERRWEEFRYAALNNLLVRQIRGGRLAEGRSALAQNGSPLDPEHRRQLEAMLLDAELVRLSTEARTVSAAEAGLDVVVDAEARSLLSADRIGELKTFFLLKAGELRSAEAGWAPAISYTRALLARYGPNRRVEEQIRVFQNNRIAELHNAFARAYNARNYDEARRLARTALEEFPGSHQLLQDQALSEKAPGGPNR